MRVLICDDRAEDCEATKNALVEGVPDGVDCELMHSDELKDNLEKFFAQVRLVLDPETKDRNVESDFDGYDVILIDNALTHITLPGSRLTAEVIAGYIRAFSTSPYIVSLNKNDRKDFDLSYLVGDRTTRADLAINTEHLENKALWTGRQADAADRFLPWYWPALLDASDRRRRQIAFVEEHLDASILDSLDFPPEAIDNLSRHALSVLSPLVSSDEEGDGAGKPAEEITFRQFFEAHERSLPAREDRETTLSKGLTDVIAKVAAADLDLWFRRDLLGPQDVLVDLAHLVARMPFLLGDRAGSLAAWNEAVATTEEPFGFQPEIYEKHIKNARHSNDDWCARPTFWWPRLKRDDQLNELFFGDDVIWPDFVFCEDTSQFSVYAQEGEDSRVTEFAAEFGGAWDRRFVSRLEGKSYEPRSRFSV